MAHLRIERNAGTAYRHRRSAIFRRIKKHTTDLDEQLARFSGYRPNGNGELFLPDGRFIQISGVKNLGDEENWRGEAHDGKFFDRIERGGGFTAETYERFMAHFACADARRAAALDAASRKRRGNDTP